MVAPALEELLYQPIPVLDKGFVRVIDYMGDDHAIVQAARVSYGAGTKTVRTDAGLIDYLMRHQHTSPFEMCDIKLHVKLPVFVARQWIRHRTASVNEYSGRYSEIADTFYEPEPSAIGRQSALNRQGSAGAVSSTRAAGSSRTSCADAASKPSRWAAASARISGCGNDLAANSTVIRAARAASASARTLRSIRGRSKTRRRDHAATVPRRRR